MELAALIGISISDFWDMTPHELNTYANAFSEREKQEYKQKIELAYINAMWTIQWLGKKQPKPLQDILDSIGKEKKVMTDEQMLAKVKALNAMFGGEVKSNE